MKIIPFGKANPDDIENIQKNRNIHFPEFYTEFLQNYNGGIIDKDDSCSVLIAKLNIPLSINQFFGINTKDEKNDIIKVNEKHSQDLPENAYIIGEDINNGFFVLFFEDNNSVLCFWDESLSLPISSDDGNAYLVSDSLESIFNDLKIKNKNNSYEKGEKIMEKINYIPLGSVVYLKGSIQKLLVTSRGILVNKGDKELFFDYAGVLYPDGLISDDIVYFNHETISKVVFEGYHDEDDAITVENINKYVEEHPALEKGSAEKWNA